jgi:uncharacterized protein YyaL (SSP411 family)
LRLPTADEAPHWAKDHQAPNGAKARESRLFGLRFAHFAQFGARPASGRAPATKAFTDRAVRGTMAHQATGHAPAKANALASEPSPYLRQHMHNPVDWRPWGDAAFAEARRRDVPVFVSIGYATCHWCHVMAHESFEDLAVAALMNEAFVNVKVDREERPDIDDACMAVCQAMTGSGGWPLTVVMTPDRKPFFAGTYFPKQSRHGRIGMLDLVPRITEAWQGRRKELLEQAEHVLRHMAATESPDAVPLGAETLQQAEQAMAKRHDAAHGGFGGPPKFPSPHTLLFLLRRWSRTQDPGVLQMVTRTLHAMADGGIHDHVGGGFHRYSTDAQWLLPHFEKMLYDQAMLAMAYTEAYQATREARFADVARGILDYVLRDLKDPAGGFRCAEDADSEGEEGKFYVWTKGDLERALGTEAHLVASAYGVSAEGNFHDEATHRLTGANILHLPRPLTDVASANGVAVEDLDRRLAAARATLLAVRSRRVRPQLDDKVLTDWNGLAIAAFAKAGHALQEPRFVAAAVAAAAFLRREMRDGRGGLLHRWHDGRKDAHSFLDDHAFLLWGLVELYGATLDPAWLAWAQDVAGRLVDRFADGSGAFSLSPKDGEDLGLQRRDAYDGALPSGNSAAAYALLRLGLLTGEERWTAAGRAVLDAFSAQVAAHPQAFTMMLCAVDLDVGPTRELVVAGEGAGAARLLEVARHGYQPRLAVLQVRDGLAAVAPWTKDHKPLASGAAAYLCEAQACKAPTADPAALAAQLAGKA